MAYEIPVLNLDRKDRKTLEQATNAVGKHATVKRVRALCSPGPVMTAVWAVLTAVFLASLGALFLPLLFAAPLALVVVPLQIAQQRQKWLQILPPERDDELVVLRYA